MTVAYLFGSLNRGGTETLMLDVFRSVQAHQFTLIGIYRKEGALLSDFQASGKEMFPLPLRSNLLKYLSDLRSLVKQHKIEILHAVQSLDAVLADFACKGLNVKVVQTIHSFDKHFSWVSKLLMIWSLKLSDVSVFVSSYQRDYYVNKYLSSATTKCQVVLNGIAMDKLLPKVEKENSDQLQLLTVGNFNAGRDQLILCKFALRLKNENIPFKWQFVGKQDEKEPWRFNHCVEYVKKNNLSEHVKFLGERTDVPHFLAKADLFVYASEHDTFGIAVVEALAAGVPVLVNDWPVMNELTDNGKLATVYKSSDENDFMNCFFKTTSFAKSNEIAELVKTRFSIQEHINALVTIVYHPLLKA